jgi:hypothetical protein
MNLSHSRSPRVIRAPKIAGLGQYFDFGSFASFFSSGFGSTLTNLATTIATTEIKNVLGPKPVGPAATPVLPTQYPVAPTGTAGAVAVYGPPAPLPQQPNIPGQIPGAYPLNSTVQNTPSLLASLSSGQPIIAGVPNTYLLIGAGLVLFVALRK